MWLLGRERSTFHGVLAEMNSVIGNLPWWCVDFCFNPQTPTAGKEAVPVVRRLMDEVIK